MSQLTVDEIAVFCHTWLQLYLQYRCKRYLKNHTTALHLLLFSSDFYPKQHKSKENGTYSAAELTRYEGSGAELPVNAHLLAHYLTPFLQDTRNRKEPVM